MATADDVIVEFEARIGRYEADLRRGTRAFETATGKQRAEMAKLERDIARNTASIGSSLRGLAATFAAAFSVQQIQQLADGYTRFTNQLKVAGLEGKSLAETQKQLADIANRNGADLESLGTLYSRGAQVAGELGASQADLIKFTEGTAAALRIQGTAAQEARGALLQLAQLLATGTVRSEEFNSVNEGALPILQAVARNIDAAGGSVGRLKTLVADGEITSQQFFRAFLAGSEQLQEQAEKTTLTIGNSFTILNNKLGEYIGQTDQSLSATQRISAAIIALADNIDTVVKVLAVIVAALGARYVAAAVAAARNTAIVTAALTAMQARAAGTITTMAALSTTGAAAGRSLLAAFGGPIGASVLALTVAFGYLASEAYDAAQATAELESKADEAKTRADELEQRLRDAGVGADVLGRAARSATGDIDGLNDSMSVAITTAFNLAKQLQQLEAVKIAGAIAENRRKSQGLTRQGEFNTLSGSMGLASPEFAKKNPTLSDQQKQQQAALDREYGNLSRQLNALAIATERGIDITDKASRSVAAAVEKDKPKPKPKPTPRPKKDTGPTPEEIEERFQEQLARLNQEELQARISLATSAQERADLQIDLLKAEYSERLAQIDNDKFFTKEQKAAQKAALSALYGLAEDAENSADGGIVVTGRGENGLYGKLVRRELNDELNRQLQDELALQADVLEAQADIAISNDERRRLEREALEIQQQIQRFLLEQAIANGQIADADKARALLAAQQSASREGQSRQQMSPLEQYKFDLTSISANINEAIEGIAVDQLQSLTSTLADAIVNFRSLGDVGTAALRSLTAAVIELALQQIILKTIGKSLGADVAGTSAAEGAAVAAAWAPAAAAVALATLGQAALPAAAALAGTYALSAGLAAATGRKDGGPIYGPGGPREDKVLIAASPEEYMIQARAARKLGRSALDFMNATGELPGRADGGPVMPTLPRGTPAARSGGSDASGNWRNEFRAALAEAARTMPPINLYPTLDPGNVMRAALATTGGRKAMFDFVSANSGKFRSQLD